MEVVKQVPEPVLKFLATANGPSRLRRALFIPLIHLDVDVRFEGWSILAYVIRCGCDDDIELVEHLLRIDPNTDIVVCRNNLLDWMIAGKWKHERMKLIRLLFRTGLEFTQTHPTYRLSAEEAISLMKMGMRLPSRTYAYFLAKTKVTPQNFRYIRYALKFTDTKRGGRKFWHLLTDCRKIDISALRGIQGVELLMRRGSHACDKYGIPIKFVHDLTMLSDTELGHLFDQGLSPISADSTHSMLRNMRYQNYYDSALYIVRRFPELLTFGVESCYLDYLIINSRIETLQKFIVVPNIELTSNYFYDFTFRRSRDDIDSFDVFKSVVETLAQDYPEDQREEFMKSVARASKIERCQVIFDILQKLGWPVSIEAALHYSLNKE